jgi:hypothetical protein
MTPVACLARSSFAVVAMLLAAVACSCSKSSSDSAPAVAGRACDPLAAEAAPIALAEVIGAGRAADGTVFVLDRERSNIRGFVSEGNVLRRKNVVGSGETPDFVAATLDDPSGRIEVRVDIANGRATRMGVARALDPGSKTFEIGPENELTLLSPADLSSFQVANIAGIGVMYAATTEDGHRFFAFEPTIDLSNDAVRVFYGTPDRMIERRVAQVARSSFVIIDFDLEGTRTIANLTFCLTPGVRPTLQPTDGPIIPLTPIPGSPGGTRCPSFDGTDAGPDAGSEEDGGLPDRVSPPGALVSGLSFVCF